MVHTEKQERIEVASNFEKWRSRAVVLILIAALGVVTVWGGWRYGQWRLVGLAVAHSENAGNVMGQSKGFAMKDDFKAKLGLKELPVELDKLIDFQELQSGPELYAQCFYVIAEDREKSGLAVWSHEKSFLQRFYSFAQANGSGSTYAIWDDGSGSPLGQMPVVVFGDEGGVHVVAEDFVQFLRLLTYDQEISVDHDKAYFYKDQDDYEASKDKQAYQNWLKKEFGVDPVDDPDEIIKLAQEKYKTPFDQWKKQYFVE